MIIKIEELQLRTILKNRRNNNYEYLLLRNNRKSGTVGLVNDKDRIHETDTVEHKEVLKVIDIHTITSVMYKILFKSVTKLV